MTRTARGALVALSMALSAIALAEPAAAGSDDGNFGIQVLATVVNPDTDATVSAGGEVIPGANADVSTEVIPAPTLAYYFTKNIAVELFCCFAKHSIDGKGAIATLGEIADTWIFPPALILQYHFTGMGSWKPYLGAGVQYINFFDTGTGQNSSARPASASTIRGASRSKPASTSVSAMAGRSISTSRRPGSTPPSPGITRRSRPAGSTSSATRISTRGSSPPVSAIASISATSLVIRQKPPR